MSGFACAVGAGAPAPVGGGGGPPGGFWGPPRGGGGVWGPVGAR
jgi:hypothetical protein